jgi:hypothetical protein
MPAALSRRDGMARRSCRSVFSTFHLTDKEYLPSTGQSTATTRQAR